MKACSGLSGSHAPRGRRIRDCRGGLGLRGDAAGQGERPELLPIPGLPNVCAQLTAATDSKEVDLRYINPIAQRTQYNKVLIEPVTFWGGDDTKVSASGSAGADERTFSSPLVQELGKTFQVVDQPGPGRDDDSGRARRRDHGHAGAADGLDVDSTGTGPRHVEVRRHRHVPVRRLGASRGEDHRLGHRAGPRGGGGQARRWRQCHDRPRSGSWATPRMR